MKTDFFTLKDASRAKRPQFFPGRSNNLRKCLGRAAKAFRFRATKVCDRFPVRGFQPRCRAPFCQLSRGGSRAELVRQVWSVAAQADSRSPPARFRSVRSLPKLFVRIALRTPSQDRVEAFPRQ